MTEESWTCAMMDTDYPVRTIIVEELEAAEEHIDHWQDPIVTIVVHAYCGLGTRRRYGEVKVSLSLWTSIKDFKIKVRDELKLSESPSALFLEDTGKILGGGDDQKTCEECGITVGTVVKAVLFS